MTYEIKKIGDVATVISGFAFKSADLDLSHEIPVIKIGNISEGGQVNTDDTERFAENSIQPKHDKYWLKDKDIILAMTGATAGKAGRIHCGTSEKFLLNQRVAKILPEEIDADFFWQIIRSQYYRTIFQSLGGGSAQPNFSSSQIENVEINVPSNNLQRVIGGFARDIDNLIENNRRRIALLEESARLLYREWFALNGNDKARENWTKGTVSDLGEVITGKTPSKKKEHYFNGDVPFIKTPDMHNNTFIITTEETLTEEGALSQANKTVPEFTTLVSCIGTLGVVSMTQRASQFNQQINAVVPKDIYWSIYNWCALREIRPKLEAFGDGSTMANVNKTKFSRIEIVLPDEDTIKKFYELCKPIIDQIQNLATSNKKLAQARDLLLPRLMDGRVTL